MAHSYNNATYKNWYLKYLSFGSFGKFNRYKYPKFTKRGTSKARKHATNTTNGTRRTSERNFQISIKKDLDYVIWGGDVDKNLLSHNLECYEPWNW